MGAATQGWRKQSERRRRRRHQLQEEQLQPRSLLPRLSWAPALARPPAAATRGGRLRTRQRRRRRRHPSSLRSAPSSPAWKGRRLVPSQTMAAPVRPSPRRPHVVDERWRETLSLASCVAVCARGGEPDPSGDCGSPHTLSGLDRSRGWRKIFKPCPRHPSERLTGKSWRRLLGDKNKDSSFWGRRFFMEAPPQPRTSGIKKEYPCPECGRNFKRNSHLVRHKRLHTGEKPYKCPECGKSFRQSTDVNTHRRIHTGETPFQCKQCAKCFRYRTGLVKHVRAHEEEKAKSRRNCLECGKIISGTLVSVASQTSPAAGESHKCPDCAKNTQESSHLVVHLPVRATEENYMCPDCGEGFCHSFQLIGHRNLHTRFQIPNPGTLCGLEPGVAPLPSDHRDEEQRESPGSMCGACDDAVPTGNEEEDPSSHERLSQTLLGRLQILDPRRKEASKARPGFSKGQWKRPAPRGRETAEDGSSASPVCERFLRSERRHLCFMCGKRFRYESHLVIHERIHTGEKPFECSTCHKGFRDRSDLSKHQKTHSEDKPYKCLDCGKSFHHQLTFIRHQRLHPRESSRDPGRVYFAILPSFHVGAEMSIGDGTEPAENLGFPFKQKVTMWQV